LRTWVDPKNHIPTGGAILRGKGQPIVKYRNTGTLCGHLCKNGSTNHDAVFLDCGLGLAQGIMSCIDAPLAKAQFFGESGAHCKE